MSVEVGTSGQNLVMDWMWDESKRQGSRMTSGLLIYTSRSVVVSCIKKGKAEDGGFDMLWGNVKEAVGLSGGVQKSLDWKEALMSHLGGWQLWLWGQMRSQVDGME